VLGHEDLNDHLRRDIALQAAVDTDGVLASQSTLCRFEQRASRYYPRGDMENRIKEQQWLFRTLTCKRVPG